MISDLLKTNFCFSYPPKIFLFFMATWAFCFAEEDFEEQQNCLRWNTSIEFLRWMPCTEETEYTAERSNSTYSIHEISPEWENGFRIGLAVEGILDQWDLWLSYTHLEADTSSHRKATGALLPVNISPADIFYNEAKAHWRMGYKEWKALLGYDILYNENYRVKTLFGLTGITSHEYLKTQFSGDSEPFFTRWKQHSTGIGGTFGILCGYHLSEDFEFVCLGSGSLLAGRGHSSSQDSNIKSKDHAKQRMICGYEIGARLVYDTSLLNKDALLHLGYQFVQWQNLPYDRFAAQQRIQSHKPLGFHGMTLGLNLIF